MDDKTKRQREWRRRKRLGLVVHQVETKPELIPEIDRFNREMMEKMDDDSLLRGTGHDDA